MIAFQFRESLRGERLTLPSLVLYNKLQMAKTIIHQKRELAAGYHIYQQHSQAGKMVIVRRKVAMPTDVEHRSSKETRRQRERFAQASKRWAQIPSIVKADMQESYGIVDVQTPHGKSDIEVLQGRQLFIAEEIHQEKWHQEHVLLPWWVCIVTTDKLGRIIDVPLELGGKNGGAYTFYPHFYLSSGNTFFFPLETGHKFYQVCYAKIGWIGQIAFIYSEDEIKELRYQVVHPNITVAHAEYHGIESHPYQDNWQAVVPPEETDLAKYNVHQLISWWPLIYHPDPAISLIWRKVAPGTHSLTIGMLNLRYPMKIILSHEVYESTLWTITKDLFGFFHLNPPWRTCVFTLPTWQILYYK